MTLPTNALKIIAISSFLAIAACTDQPSDPMAQVPVSGAIATYVNGEPIYLSEVEIEAAAQGRTRPGEGIGIGHPAYQDILDQLIDQRLMAQQAVALGLHTDENAIRRLTSARERVLGNILVENLVAKNITEDRIREMYAEQVALQQIDDEVRIRHILSETEEAAAAARARIMAGEDFSTVAFEVSTDMSTRIDGGDLGYVEPNLLGEPFASQIADTAVGDVSLPFESEQGWHIMKVEDRRTPAPKTLDEMRSEIVTFLTYAEISQILKSLRNDAVLSPGDSVPRYSPDDSEAEDDGRSDRAGDTL